MGDLHEDMSFYVFPECVHSLRFSSVIEGSGVSVIRICGLYA